MSLDHQSHTRVETLVELLRWRALNEPGKFVYTFLADGETEEASLSYAELDARAREIAGWLQDAGMAGERALLIYLPGLEYIAALMGCLYAAVIAVPVPPINPAQPDRALSKLRAIASDAQPALALTTSRILQKVERVFTQDAALKSIKWVASDDLASGQAEDWQEPRLRGDMLAYLQYTSGSTATSKGVMVSHANVLHNLENMDRGWIHLPDSVIVSWLPHYHDMGLVYGILQAIYNSLPCYLMSPVAFIQRPIRWLRAISRYKGTHSAGPNFAYNHCVQKVRPEHCEGLDLSHWRVAVNGAEPVRNDTLKRFTQKFSPYGFQPGAFCPGYGLAEATLKVTASKNMQRALVKWISASELEKNRIVEAEEEDQAAYAVVGCGPADYTTRVEIVNPETLTRTSPSEIGEVWVSGPSVALGYWNREEETRKSFGARLACTDEGPFLRTGDLGFIADGELFITGRIKDMLIIAGRNHYPHDIELTVEGSHYALRPGGCAAFSIEVDGEERLIIAAEIERRIGARNEQSDQLLGEVSKAIRKAVSEDHDITVHKVILLKMGGVPKTSSGKTQRQLCRTQFLAAALPLVSQ